MITKIPRGSKRNSKKCWLSTIIHSHECLELLCLPVRTWSSCLWV